MTIKIECPECGDEGEFTVDCWQDCGEIHFTRQEKCEWCGGSGKVEKDVDDEEEGEEVTDG
jgi:hypothetical protein